MIDPMKLLEGFKEGAKGCTCRLTIDDNGVEFIAYCGNAQDHRIYSMFELSARRQLMFEIGREAGHRARYEIEQLLIANEGTRRIFRKQD